MKKRAIALMLTLSLMLGTLASVIPVHTLAATSDAGHIIEASDVPLRLYYDEEASHGVAAGYDEVDTYFGSGSDLIAKHPDDDWERWSIPLGNGYLGANVFGRTETERIQLTDKTLANPYRITSNSAYTDGLNNFSETYIDFGHKSSATSNYSRELDLRTAVSTVSYVYGGVTYTREYFVSYPDNAMVIRLSASSSGALDFVLRPTVPYEQEYMNSAGDGGGKTGTVTSSVLNNVGTILLSGTLEYFDIDFAGIYTVITNGGTVSATTCTNADGDTDGTVTVSGATDAYIIINTGTDYELSSDVFTESRFNKPTFDTDLAYAIEKVEGYRDNTLARLDGKSFEDGYTALKNNHLNDYQELFGRVSLDLDFDESDLALTTDELLTSYKNGSGSSYLEALYFQYGRYLLIASSRSGALPANLQGAWNRYNHAPWSSGYWHNINVQMNYWPAFSTNLAETFEAYVEYNNAYMQKAQNGATGIINKYNPSVSGTDGGNGWSIETGGYPADVYGSASIGNLGFTTQLFWEYYAYSGDEQILREVVYPVLVGAARFITKMVREDANGNYIAIYTDSPEQYVNGVWYYTDKGATYAQSFAYQNNYNLLLAAKELGIDVSDESGEDYEILSTVMEQIDRYSPIVIGLSGHVKEFFEEEKYGDLGEYTHRHISQLVGLYPGNIINGTTPAWMDAAKYVLTERGDKATGWGVAHRLNLWARAQDGERAYDLLEQLLSANTATNLWDLHPPFQIDGNLGGTAGISEMLLQSHAGYIEPLAAIPSSWANGSYTGLVARGGFTVAAEWANGLATCFNITSQNGGEVSVKYSGIGNAVVRKTDGTVLSYTVTDKDVITFNTEAGETYIIAGFKKAVKPAAVTGLTAESEFLGETKLTWNLVSGAASYNVYVAKESDPTYTLLANTVVGTYTYEPTGIENPRLTFAVTAVSADGTESERALVYRNPDNTDAVINEYSANLIEGELQVVINANRFASKYKLYSRTSGTASWTPVTESSYPIIIYSDYTASLQYGVSVESYYGGESEIIHIAAFNQDFTEVEYNASNILVGRVPVATDEANGYKHSNTSYGLYTLLTDGNHSYSTGRFSTVATANDVVEFTVAFGGEFILGELKFYDFNASASAALYMGQHLKVEAWLGGEWTTVKECSSSSEIVALRKSDAKGSYIGVDLTGVKAEQLRILIDSPIKDSEQRSISINEIECTGLRVGNGTGYSDNLLLNKEFDVTDATEAWTAIDNEGSGHVVNITDGAFKNSDNPTWWRLWYGKTDMTFDGTVDLGGVAYLNELRFYFYASWSDVGPDLQIFAYSDGEWTQVKNLTIDSSSRYVMKGDIGTNATETWVSVSLDGIKAEKLRVYLPPKSTTGQTYGMYEMTASGFIIPTLGDDYEYNTNILLNQAPIATETNSKTSYNDAHGGYGYEKLTDADFAIHTGRFAIDAKQDNYATVTYDLGGEAVLETLSIYDFYDGSTTPRSNETTIELLVKGEWVKYLDAQPLYTDAAATTIPYTNARLVTFDLAGYTASQIRITFKNAYAKSGKTDGVTIAEIELSGYASTVKREYSSDVFTGFAFEPGPNAGAIWTAGGASYAHLTDDVSSSRLITSQGAPIEGILDFGGKVATLYSLTVNYDSGNAKRCGQDLIIEVYRDGEWKQALSHVHTTTLTSESFDLGGVEAEMVRVTVSGKYNGGANSDGVSGDTISIHEMSCTGYLAEPVIPDGPTEDTSTNILLGTKNDQLTLTGASIHSNATVGNLEYAFDGKLDTRYAVFDASPYAYKLEIDLGSVYPLYTLSLYPFANAGEKSRSDNTTVEVYLDGAWFTIASGVSITPTQGTPTKIDLGGVKGSKIRIGFANTQWNASATIFEIECTTGTVTAVDRTALLDAYIALDSVSGTDFGFDEVKAARLEELKELLTNTGATDADISSAIEEINSAKEELSAGVPVDTTMGDFTEQSVSLDGNVGMHFYGTVTEEVVTANPDGFVYIEYADGTTEKQLLCDLERTSGGKLILSLDLAAAQMTDTVKLRMVLNGSATGELIETSVSDYSADIIAGDYDAELKSLVESMLHYGAYAQKVFNYNVDNLANAGLEAPDLSAVNETAAITVANSASGVSFKTWTLTLDSEVSAKLYFTLDGGENINAYRAMLTAPDGSTKQLVFESLGSRYRLTVENITAAYLDDGYTLTITNTLDSTSTTIEFSAMCYVATILANGEAYGEDIVNLVKAMRLYATAANSYAN